jgi:hypothetical protein
MTGQRGRPLNPALQMAKLMGDVTYNGKRCKVCNTVEKYTKGSSCVACTKDSSDKIRTKKGRARARRQARAAESLDLSDLLGVESCDQSPVADVENAIGTGVARGWHEGDSAGEAAEDASEIPTGTPAQMIDKSLSMDSGVLPDSTQLYTLSAIGETDDFGEPLGNSEAETMASPVTHPLVPADKSKLRYWCHAESGCVWTTAGADQLPGDGFVEEVSAETYDDLLKAGFTISPATDDLDDILG